jgi:predicted Zn-ribbon and HTH transcriptional regulator
MTKVNIVILKKVYAYVNQIKVYLALNNIGGIWKVVNDLTEYITNINIENSYQERLEVVQSVCRECRKVYPLVAGVKCPECKSSLFATKFVEDIE